MDGDNLNRDEDISNLSSCHFGEHLTIDGYGGSPEKLNDKKIVFDCLKELPEILRMNRLIDPQVFYAPDNNLKDPGGWSGFVIVAESHISIHTFPLRRFISIDVYSCKNGMAVPFIESFFKDKFSLQEIETNFIRRGLNYPKFNIA